MINRSNRGKSINSRIFSLISTMFVPMLALSIAILGILIIFNAQYSSISSNIITASSFNQDFKDDVDLKMYYFVSGNSDELPFDEIETARKLAATLLENTNNPDSRRSISNVLNLCDSLYASIDKIENTEGYDNRIEQLETNVYVITQLIQQHIYSYLYNEAGEIAQLQNQLNAALTTVIAIAIVVLSVVATVSVKNAFRVSRSITEPIDALSSRVEEIGHGELIEKEPIEADDEKLNLLGRGFEEMVAKLRQQTELNQEEHEKLRGIELALLQAQINPHFLYNTLDTIVWLIETGKDQEAEEMVTSLSTYFRSFLSNGKDIITLEEELVHVRSYLEIQQVRYKDRLDYRIESVPAISKCLVPKLTLQPMVENAIYHGIKPKRGKGTIEILGCLDEGYMLVTVRDTGLGMEPEALNELKQRIINGDTSGFGLVAAYKRLRLMYGDDFVFTINSDPGIGTEISIRVPFRTEEDNEAVQ